MRNSLDVIMESNGIKLLHRRTESTCISRVSGSVQWDSLLRISQGQNVPGRSRWISGKNMFSEQEEYLGLHTLPKGVWLFRTSKADWHKWERWLNETYALARIRLMKDCWQSSQCFWLWREKEQLMRNTLLEMEKHKLKGYFIMAVNLCFSKFLITQFSKRLMKFHNAHLTFVRAQIKPHEKPKRVSD